MYLIDPKFDPQFVSQNATDLLAKKHRTCLQDRSQFRPKILGLVMIF